MPCRLQSVAARPEALVTDCHNELGVLFFTEIEKITEFTKQFNLIFIFSKLVIRAEIRF